MDKIDRPLGIPYHMRIDKYLRALTVCGDFGIWDDTLYIYFLMYFLICPGCAATGCKWPSRVL